MLFIFSFISSRFCIISLLFYPVCFSSVSSSLSSAAAVAWQDIFKTYKPDISDAKGTIINKLLGKTQHTISSSSVVDVVN